jgi:hypothetical protein
VNDCRSWIPLDLTRVLDNPFAVASRLRPFQEFEVEGYEHQNNAHIRHQPFPESISQEHQIDADDSGNQPQDVQNEQRFPWHHSHIFKCIETTLCIAPVSGPIVRPLIIRNPVRAIGNIPGRSRPESDNESAMVMPPMRA